MNVINREFLHMDHNFHPVISISLLLRLYYLYVRAFGAKTEMNLNPI